MTEEQLDKLPKWAQYHIERLESDLYKANEKLARQLGDYDPKYPTYGDYDDNRGKSLPCRQVWFRNAGITVRADGDEVRVLGDGQLTITPQSTNIISLRSSYVDDQP